MPFQLENQNLICMVGLTDKLTVDYYLLAKLNKNLLIWLLREAKLRMEGSPHFNPLLSHAGNRLEASAGIGTALLPSSCGVGLTGALDPTAF